MDVSSVEEIVLRPPGNFIAFHAPFFGHMGKIVTSIQGNPGAVALDRIDRRIIELLQEDGGLSVTQLADRLGMTPPPCWRRIKALKDQGILKRQAWLVDPAKLDLNLQVYATVKLVAHDPGATTAFRERVRGIPEILECYILLGGIDVLLKIIVPDIAYYETFFYETLSQLPGTREVTSSVVMSEVKHSLALPVALPHA